MQWWCAAVSTPWSWSWRPYPGVWLFMILVIAAYARLWMRAGAVDGRRPARAIAGASGLLLIWAALDWPIGALAGYLASAHMAQFLLLAMASPPLLLLGLPVGRLRHDTPGRLTHPLVALLLFTVVVVATHLPIVTDRLMPTQLGSFVIDTAWLGAGLLFWWPVFAPRPWFTEPVRMGYLFASMVLMTAPGAMITFSELPIYATYELAPPIPGITPVGDQRLAGLNMRVGAALVIWIAISIIFLRWNRDEEELMRTDGAQLVRTGSDNGPQRGD